MNVVNRQRIIVEAITTANVVSFDVTPSMQIITAPITHGIIFLLVVVTAVILIAAIPPPLLNPCRTGANTSFHFPCTATLNNRTVSYETFPAVLDAFFKAIFAAVG
jgi:hypothetical protein